MEGKRGDEWVPAKEAPPGKLRVMLADPQTLIRKGLTSLMQNRDDLEVVGEAKDRTELLLKLPELQPDLVLMDINLPGGDGIEVIRHICHGFPEIKVVVLTTMDGEETMMAAIKAGAKGYLSKTIEPAHLFFYLAGISRGEAVIPPVLAGRILESMARHQKQPEQQVILSHREKEVLRLVAAGATNREIAETLVISENTVKNHLKNIMEKLGSKNRMQAVRLAMEHGLLAKQL